MNPLTDEGLEPLTERILDNMAETFAIDYGLCRLLAIGTLVRLQSVVTHRYPDGVIRTTPRVFAAQIDWPGHEEWIVPALIEAGKLLRHEEYKLVVRDWSRLAPSTAHRACLRRHALFWDGTLPSGQRLSLKERRNIEQAMGLPAGVLDVRQNKSKPKTLKQATTALEAERARAAEKVFEVRTHGGHHIIDRQELVRWSDAFPDLDLHHEFAMMSEYCQDNPKKRPQARSIEAYITRWLTRSQDAKRRAEATGTATQPDPDLDRLLAGDEDDDDDDDDTSR